MTDLAERIEAAGVDEQRAMLKEAYHAMLPYNSPLYDHQHRARFIGLLDAEAYESAAMMLAPEGWRRSLCDDPEDVGGVIAELWTKTGHAYATAATPALALSAAAIRAGAK